MSLYLIGLIDLYLLDFISHESYLYRERETVGAARAGEG
jgi:hypothetical protein